jgi:molybdate transport system ATP-binding protein
MPDENWMISGANGSGKTTLLNLITGDNTQAYRNGIVLFGQQKGSGESIWDIKRRIGHISTAFQRNYRVGGRVINVVLSGFYDSIGLYATPTRKQQQQAQRWLQLIKLEHKAGAPFQRLSFGEQRLVLLARAMIKTPELLILDEPCQGLDEDNRRAILQAIDQIGTRRLSQILYVTHHPEDELSCINRHLKLMPCQTGGSKAVVEQL